MSTASSNLVTPVAEEPPASFTQRLSSHWKKQSKDFGSPWLVILRVFLVFLVSQLIALFVVEVGLNLLHSHQTASDLLDKSAAAQFIYVLLAEGLAVGLVFWLLKMRGLGPAAIGWGRRPRFSDLSKGLGGFVVFFLALIIVMGILSSLFPELKSHQTQDVGFNYLNSSVDWVLAFIALIIIPPLGEETLVRGYLYSGLRSKWRFVPAMIVTSLLFGFAHLQSGSSGSLIWGAAVDTFVLSLVLVYLRESTGALYAGILVHSLNNLLAFFSHFHAAIF